MTRKEQIERATKDYHIKRYPNCTFGECAAFMAGARWADAHRWISVEDELPPRFPLSPKASMNVITYGLHTMVNWYDYERGEWVRDSEITHWMPLPQPPVVYNSENAGKKGGEE